MMKGRGRIELIEIADYLFRRIVEIVDEVTKVVTQLES